MYYFRQDITSLIPAWLDQRGEDSGIGDPGTDYHHLAEIYRDGNDSKRRERSIFFSFIKLFQTDHIQIVFLFHVITGTGKKSISIAIQSCLLYLQDLLSDPALA